MPPSNSTITVSKFDIGPCRVNYNAVDLGGTLGNVSVAFKYDKAPMKADQLGGSILDEAVTGLDITVETELAEVVDKSALAAVFPNATLVTKAGPPLQHALDFANAVSNRMLSANAKVLILHPLNQADAAMDNDWYFYKAAPTEESQYVFSPTEQGKLKIVWRIYIPADGTAAFRMGDHTVA